MGLDKQCLLPHLSILHHMLLHLSFATHSLYFFLGFPNSCLLCLKLTERFSTPHISATSMLQFPSCYLTPAMYISNLRSHVRRTSISLLANANIFAPYSRADLTQASYTLPLVLSLMLRFIFKLATISRHFLHAAVTLACTGLFTPASLRSAHNRQCCGVVLNTPFPR